MSSDAAFLQAILESPDDDAPRLIYADWLEDHGTTEADRARAEFIRIQCRLARLDDFDPDRHDLEEREAALVDALGDIWQPDIPPDVRSIPKPYRRGFVAELQLDGHDWLADPRRWASRTPVEGYRFASHADLMPRLAESPELARVKRLTVTGASDEDVRKFASSPHLGRLETLGLPHGDLTDQGARLLARARLPRLKSLDLGFNEVGAVGLRAILESSHLESLRRLDLVCNPLGLPGLEALARHRGLARIRGLNLQGVCAMRQEGASLLAASPFVGGLRELDLACDEVGDEGLKLLATLAELGDLEVLNLYRNDVGPAGVAELVRTNRLPRLRRLELANNNRLREEGARILARGRIVPQLRHLGLWNCDLGDDGVKVLARSSGLSGLTSLDLGSNRITDEGVSALARSRHLRNLRSLSLNSNQIGDAGLAALARSRMLRSVTSLSLVRNQFGTPGLGALARSGNLPRLRRLNLKDNQLDDRAGGVLVRARGLSDSWLFVLEIGTLPVGPAVRAALQARFGVVR